VYALFMMQMRHIKLRRSLYYSLFRILSITTAPPPAPASAPPIPPPRFRERDETEVRPLAVDPRLFDLQRATTARVRRFRYVPVESWLLAQRDPAAVDLFSTRIQESFFRA
jgi:hypothetical protein